MTIPTDNGANVAGRVRITLSVYTDGRWQSDGGVAASAPGRVAAIPLGREQGMLTPRQLRKLAEALAAQDLLGLPQRVQPNRTALLNPGADVAFIRIRFRAKSYQGIFLLDHLEQHDARWRDIPGTEATERFAKVCHAMISTMPFLSELKQSADTSD
jgi:hypothetical protein